MRNLIWSKTFIKAFKRVVRKRPEQREEIEKALHLLVANPFAPQLVTHELKGKLSGTWACSAGYDLRIVFEFVKKTETTGDEENFLIEIGTHDEVYYTVIEGNEVLREKAVTYRSERIATGSVKAVLNSKHRHVPLGLPDLQS